MDALAEGKDGTVKLTASCHCRLTNYTFVVPTDCLPLQAYLCHCNISRRISGLLCTSYVPVPSSNPPPEVGQLNVYKSSAILNRWFCSACGTHLFLEYNFDGHFEVSTGTVSPAEGPSVSYSVVRFNGSMWIGDTLDGGASVWFPSANGKPAERWLVAPQESSQVSLTWGRPTTSQADSTSVDLDAANANREDRLYAHCHCGGVEFFISRPDSKSLKATSPYPDVLIPYDSGQSIENLQGVSWWLSGDEQRYTAGICACNSCRRSSGFDLTAWAFVPAANIYLPSGGVFSSQLFGTARTYRSSPNVTRWFCSRCGANVFWIGDERPSLIDVAVGLFDAKSGVRAEEWLEWMTARISFRESGHNKTLIEAFQGGLQMWTQSRA